MIFLYKVLDDSKVTNEKFASSLEKKVNTNDLYKLLAEDIAEGKTFSVSEDDDKNSILTFETYNSYNNPFYLHVTYLLSSNSKLVRIESKDKFEKEKTPIEFYEDKSYIDILLEDIEKFEVLTKDNKVVFIIKQKDKKKVVFTTFGLR